MSSLRVDHEHVTAFKRDGVVVVRNQLDANALAALSAAVEYNLANPSEWAYDYTPEGSTGRFFSDYVSWPRIDAYRHAALESQLPELARTLMESATVRFFHEHLLVKEPDTAEVTPWHHDEPYYCVDGSQNVSLWISLDPVPAEAGVQFLLGSHLWGRRFVPRKFVDATPYADATQGFELVPNIDSERSQHSLASFDIEPGDVLAFHFRTLHCAPGTAGRTPYRRRALSLRYVGDDATFALRPWLHSPPFTADDMTVGGPLDDSRFPLVSPRVSRL